MSIEESLSRKPETSVSQPQTDATDQKDEVDFSQFIDEEAWLKKPNTPPVAGAAALGERPTPSRTALGETANPGYLPYLSFTGTENLDVREPGAIVVPKPSLLEQSRAELFDASKSIFKAVHGKYQAEYFKLFEKSIKEMEAGLKERKLSATEVADCMKCLKRVIADSTSTELTPVERLNLVRDLVKLFGDPTTTEQLGNTCTVNSLMVNMLWREPSKVGKLVAETVLTGRFTAKDGTIIKAPESVIHPPGGARPCAEQVAAAMAVNVRWQRSTFGPTGKCKKGDVVYDPFAVDGDGKRGERLLIEGHPFKGYWNPKTKTYAGADSPNMSSSELPVLYEQIAGHRPDQLVAVWGTGKSERGNLNYRSVEDLDRKLGDLKKKAGGLPLIITVDIRNPPFFKDSGYSTERPPSVASHVVNIIDYEYDPISKQGYVWIDNTWGKSKDHSGKKNESARLTIKELYDACREFPRDKAPK